MVQVKPDEISAIIKQELSGAKTVAELQEIGTVLQVGDGIARIYGWNSVQAGELVEFDTVTQAIALNLEEDKVGVVLVGEKDDIVEWSNNNRTRLRRDIDVSRR